MPDSAARPRRPGWHWSQFFAASVLLAAIFLPLPQGGVILGLPKLCTFYSLTGLPCPGCGLTRSFVCLAHGRLHEALLYHPLGPGLFLGFLTYLLFRPQLMRLRLNWRTKTLLVLALGVLVTGVWIGRLSGHIPFGPEAVPGLGRTINP